MTTQTTSLAYCVKCKEKRAIRDPQPVTLKNGSSALQGTCSTCGTKLFRLVARRPSA